MAPGKVFLAVLALCATVSVVSASSLKELWPYPAMVQCTSAAKVPVHVTDNMTIDSTVKSSVLDAAVKRYAKLILKDRSTSGGAVAKNAVSALKIEVSSDDETLASDTDTRYELSLKLNDQSVMLKANTIYGAIAGLETFMQLFEGEVGCPCTSFTISDEPTYAHRAIMVDVARRYYPMDLMKNIINGMSVSKLNALHLHFADFGGVRVLSEDYSNLTNLVDGPYSHGMVTELVKYGKERGVRIIPEIEITDHTSGFRAISEEGMYFCGEGMSTRIAVGKGSKTIEVLTKYVQQLAKWFTDDEFHIGGNLVTEAAVGNCTAQAAEHIQETIVKVLVGLKKKPIAYSQAYSWSKAAVPGLVSIVSGEGANPTPIADLLKDNVSVIKGGPGLYLNSDPTTQQLYCEDAIECFWKDFTPTENGTPLNGTFRGAVASAFSNLYCNSVDCGAPKPDAYLSAWMGDRKYDTQFVESAAKLIFPRASIMGAALWNYHEMQNVSIAIDAHNTRLRSRGVTTCGSSPCLCKESQYCGADYSPKERKEKVFEFGMIICLCICLVVFVTVAYILVKRALTPKETSGYSEIKPVS